MPENEDEHKEEKEHDAEPEPEEISAEEQTDVDIIEAINNINERLSAEFSAINGRLTELERRFAEHDTGRGHESTSEQLAEPEPEPEPAHVWFKKIGRA